MMKLLNIILARKGFISFTLLRIGTMILALASNIFIVRKLTVEDFGVFSIAVLVVNLIITFGFSWSSSSILYFGSRELERHGSINKTFWARNIIIFISLIIVTFVIVAFRDQIDAYIGINIWYLLLLWLYVGVIEDYLNTYFLAVKRQMTSSLLSITARIIYIALIIVFPLDVKTLVTFYIISQASVILYVLGINRKDIGGFEFDKLWFKKVLNFSLWQLFGFSGIYLLNFGDAAVVKYFMTNEDVGIYNAAYQLFNAVAGFAFVISSYYASNVSAYFESNQYDKVQSFYYKERFFIIIISVAGHILLIILSKYIITTMYGQAYTRAVPIFNILMFGSMISYVTVFYMLYFNTNGKHHVQQIINIFDATLNVGLSILLIKIFGLHGPAIATVLTLVLSLLFSIWYCEKRIKKFISKG